MNAAIQLGLDFVINAAWQLVAIALVALAADRLMRGIPRRRHMIWVAALILSLSLPVLSAAPALQPRSAPFVPPARDVSMALSPDVDSAIPLPVASASSFRISRTIAVLLVAGFLFGFAFGFYRIMKAVWKTRAIRRGAEPFELDPDMRTIVGRCETVFDLKNY